MKLVITSQFQKFLNDIGADINILLQKAEIPNKLWKEKVNLTTFEYYRLLQEFDRVMSEQNIRILSNINNIQMFVPAFFAALSSSNGLEAIDRFARFKKVVGPINVEVIESDTTVSISYRYVHREMMLPKFSVLNEQLLLLSIIRTGIGENIVPIVVESPFEYDEETISDFGVLVQKNENNRLIFDKKDLVKPFLTQNNIMWQYLETELTKKFGGTKFR